MIRLLSPRPQESILDAGCGIGYLAAEICRMGSRTVGIDLRLSGRAAFIARRMPRLEWVRGDILQMPFADGVFDKIMLSSVIQMVSDDLVLARECRRIMKQDGILVLSVPLDYIHYSWLNANQERLRQEFGSQGKAFYRPDEIERTLTAAGFRIEQKAYCPGFWTSWFYETILFLAMKFRLNRLEWAAFPWLFPVVKLLSRLERRNTGDELLIKARRS